MNIFGYMLVNWINFGLSYAGGAIAWRLPLALQLMFIVVLYATVPWLPESPRYEILDPQNAHVPYPKRLADNVIDG